jgi:hypothetical protein
MMQSAPHQLGPLPSSRRMRTVDSAIVRAPLREIFRIAAAVEDWPRHLPHYRYVRFRERTATGGVVEMSANRPFGPLNWPTWWVSLMELQERGAGGGAPAIRFRHIGGITTRMDVEWAFEPVTGGVAAHRWHRGAGGDRSGVHTRHRIAHGSRPRARRRAAPNFIAGQSGGAVAGCRSVAEWPSRVSER